MTTVVQRNDDLRRYEIHIDDELAGFVTYQDDGNVVTLVHTETEPEFKGQGVASNLVQHVLDDLRSRGMHLIPRCPFVREYVDEHPEYQDLLAEQI